MSFSKHEVLSEIHENEIDISQIYRNKLIFLGVSPLLIHTVIDEMKLFNAKHFYDRLIPFTNFFNVPIGINKVAQAAVLSDDISDYPEFLLRYARGRDHIGNNICHYAALSRNSINLQNILLEGKCANWNGENYWGQTVPHYLALSGNLGGLKLFNERCPELLEREDNKYRTILHFAAASDHPIVFQWIADTKPSLITKRCNSGLTIIDYAKKTKCNKQIFLAQKFLAIAQIDYVLNQLNKENNGIMVSIGIFEEPGNKINSLMLLKEIIKTSENSDTLNGAFSQWEQVNGKQIDYKRNRFRFLNEKGNTSTRELVENLKSEFNITSTSQAETELLIINKNS